MNALATPGDVAPWAERDRAAPGVKNVGDDREPKSGACAALVEPSAAPGKCCSSGGYCHNSEGAQVPAK